MNHPNFEFKTIAVATDLSDSSSAALRYAQSIAHTFHATLVVVHVIDLLAYAFPEGAPAFLAANKAAREELSRMEDEARCMGVAVHSVVESGVVCERILQAVAAHRADLLVLGTRARTEAGKVALGSVARQLLVRAHCPIMAVSPQAAEAMPWSGRCRRILAATDFSPASIEGLRLAQQIASRHLFALHVTRNGSESESLEKLLYLAPFDESHSVPVDHIVISGNAGERIPEEAAIVHADLIVLGAPLDELTEENLYDSTVLQVIAKSACPVLCMPYIAREAARPVMPHAATVSNGTH